MQSLDVILLHTWKGHIYEEISVKWTLLEQAKVFAKESATPEEIFIAGEQVLVT